MYILTIITVIPYSKFLLPLFKSFSLKHAHVGQANMCIYMCRILYTNLVSHHNVVYAIQKFKDVIH